MGTKIFKLAVLLVGFLGMPETQAEIWGGVEGRWMAWGAGARAIGLGRAYTALAQDASASYWNPAGLAALDRPQAMALRAQMWEGVTYDYATIALPTLRYGTFGLSGTMLNAGGGERRDAENNVVGGEFSATKTAWTLSYGMWATAGLELGIAVTYLGRWVDGLGSGFFTGDLGMRYTVMPGVMCGVTAKHAMSSKWGETKDELPMEVRMGVAASLGEGMTVAAEFEQAGRFSVGFEVVPMAPLRLRMGTGGWESTAGAGIAFDQVTVDYSAALHRELGVAHRVAVSLSWGESVSATRFEKARESFEKAYASYREGRVERAVELLGDALVFDPEHSGAQYLKGKLEKEAASPRRSFK